MTPGELEEIGLPDYGFAGDGTLAIAVGPATAELTINEADALDVTWRGARGQPLKGPPAEVKENHADALKLFKAQAKEIGDTLKAQRLRLERLYLDEREWPLADWQARYRDSAARRAHGATADLVVQARRALGGRFAGGRRDPRWERRQPRSHRQRHPGPALAPHAVGRQSRPRLAATAGGFRGDAAVQAGAPRDLRLDRRRTADHGVLKPFRRSRRAAEAIPRPLPGARLELSGLRQLGSGRGSADGALAAEIQVEFWVEPIEGEIDAQDFHFRYLSTDQVRFANGDGEPIALEQVPPVLFSELMRDADLFVGVASIGNDPTWGDRGDGAYGDYWNRAAFGALSEAAKTRRAVLQDSCLASGSPSCAAWRIASSSSRGRRSTLQHHLGSANVQMAPNDQYCALCPRARMPAKSACRTKATRCCSRSSSRRHSC